MQARRQMGRADGFAYACCFGLFTWGLLIAGVVMIPVGKGRQDHVKSLDMEKDFPPMSNSMEPSGTCQIIRLWFRSIAREERAAGCTSNCGSKRVDICFDQYFAEFAWNGGPSNDCEECTEGQANIIMQDETRGSGMAGLSSGVVKTREDHDCWKSCNRYGGWRPGNYNPAFPLGPDGFANVAISQAWEKRTYRDGPGCDHNDESLKRDPYEHMMNRDEETYWFDKGNLTCRVPAKGVDSVSDVYDCPDNRYNSLCARLGDLPEVEIEEYGSVGKALVIAGARAAMRVPAALPSPQRKRRPGGLVGRRARPRLAGPCLGT